MRNGLAQAPHVWSWTAVTTASVGAVTEAAAEAPQTGRQVLRGHG